MLGMEQMYKMALDPRIFPDSRLLAVLQGKDNSLPMAVAMSAKQQRDKLEQAKAGQQAQMGAKQPTVRDTMLAKDLPQPQAGLDQLPVENMQAMGEPGMAAGGIVAFGMGGFTDPDDDDDDDTTEQDELDSLMARQGDLGGLGAGIMAVSNPQAPAYSSFTKPGISPASTPGTFKDMAAEAAKRHGASWDLVQHVMGKETGGMKDPAHAVSSKGATGVMQLMPKTAKELGVTDLTDPSQNINAGVKYLAQLEHKYKDPKLAAMAYNWGPGNVDKWMKHGSKESAVPKETRMYVASLAEGGAVGFDEGGYTSFGEENPYDPNEPSISDTIGNMLGSPIERIKNSMLGVGAKSNKEIATDLAAAKETKNKPAATPAPVDNTPPAISYEDAQKMEQQQGGPTRAENATSIPPSPSQDLLTQYLSNLEQSRKQAPGLGLMAAGLGIAAQRSPYALSNVGAGGLQGLQSYAQSQKEDQAGQAAALSAQAALERNKVYAQHYAGLAQQGQDVKYSSQLQGLNGQIEKEIADSAILKNSPQQAAAYRQRRMPELLKQNPALYNWYQSQGGSTVPSSVQLQNAPGNVIGSVKQ
jgi:hypothetical protein